MALNHKQKFAAARIKACVLAPYFSAAIYGLMPCPRPNMVADLMRTIGVGAAMAVSETSKLYYDPDVIENEWTTDDVIFGVLHEVGHLLRDHAGLQREAGFDPRIWNAAGDAVINSSLVKMGLTPLDTDILPCRIPDDNGRPMPDGKMELVYYNQLRKQSKDQQTQAMLMMGGGEDDDGDGDGEEGEGEGEGGEGKSKGKGKGKCLKRPGLMCGSGAGNKLEQVEGEGNVPHGEGDGRSPIDVDRIRKSVAAAIKEHEKSSEGRGSIPGEWSVWADQELEAPKVRWQDKMARIQRGVVSRARGMSDYSYGRPSRRQAGVGWGVGKPYFPTMVRVVPIVGFFVDTSGSMNKDDLRLAMQEAKGALRSAPCEMYFGACDAQVADGGIRKIERIEDALAMLTGGGGTDFRPVFEAVEALPLHRRPHLMLFATDGDGPAPEEPPPGITVVWVLVGKHAVVPYKGSYGGPRIDWGEVIHVTDEGARQVGAEETRLR